jgi:hypothetical protein
VRHHRCCPLLKTTYSSSHFVFVCSRQEYYNTRPIDFSFFLSTFFFKFNLVLSLPGTLKKTVYSLPRHFTYIFQKIKRLSRFSAFQYTHQHTELIIIFFYALIKEIGQQQHHPRPASSFDEELSLLHSLLAAFSFKPLIYSVLHVYSCCSALARVLLSKKSARTYRLGCHWIFRVSCHRNLTFVLLRGFFFSLPFLFILFG